MVEFFANSLVNGFLGSNLTGQGIVLIQILASVVMVACAIGKWHQLKVQQTTMSRVTRDIMGEADILAYHLARRQSMNSTIENIYNATCSRMLRQLVPEVRAQLMARVPGTTAVLTPHEMDLVKAQCDHVLDLEEIRVRKGMDVIATVVTLSPLLGLLGTVWGVLDAFAEMGGTGATSTVSINAIAPSISAALVTTVVGLLVAIPGTLLCTRLEAVIRKIVSDMDGFADNLMGRLAVDYEGRSL